MPNKSEKPISLRPLSFNEAVSDLLKVKPEAKATKPPKKAKPKHKKKTH